MSTDLLFDFSSSSADDPSDWRPVDDPVMGGVSASTFEATPDGAAFTGTVSLEQGGGFCSVRAPDRSYNLSGADGLRLRLRGDGKRYWVTLYTDPGGSLSYRAPVEPPAQWTTLDLPFARLTAYRRGTPVPDAPPFSPAQVRTLGFLIADKQAGPFQLEVAWIRAVADAA